MDDRLLDRLPDAIVLLTADGTVVDVNDRARTVLGITDRTIGRRADEVLELRDGMGRRMPLPLPRPAHGQRNAECVAQVVDASGRGRAVAITGRWSDELWAMTARGAGRREALDRVRGDVVATVSHEIRSPLTSVKGFTRTLIARWERFSDEQKLTMLETIDADADRVTRLLNDLLEVARIDTGRVRLSRAPTSLGELCATVVEKAGHREDGADRELVLTVDPRTPTVALDADRIEQVLTNLIDNALVHARTGRVTIDVAPDGDGVRVRVGDEGPGIAEDLRHVIFRKFGRGRADRRSGTGLGLYIARGLAEAHDGRLWLGEQQPTGACFNLWLPAAPTAPGP